MLKDTVKCALFDGFGQPTKMADYKGQHVGQHFAVLHAIRMDLKQDRRRWQVNHRGTGYRVSLRDYPTKSLAIEHATRLERQAKRLGIDLNESSPTKLKVHPKFKQLGDYAGRLNRKLLASI